MKKILLLLCILIIAFITVPMAGATTMFANSATFGPDILHELMVKYPYYPKEPSVITAFMGGSSFVRPVKERALLKGH
ncbi:MAG: hypothetical protein WC836_12825 [Desulfobacula sp.]